MLKLLQELEAQAHSSSHVANLSNDDLDEVVRRLEELARLLKDQRRHKEEECLSGNDKGHHQIPSEVLRQVLPFLTALDIGRSMLLCSKSVLRQVGSETVWRAICKHMWPSPPRQDIVSALSSYESYFRQRRKSIRLMEHDDLGLLLPPLAPATAALSNACLLLDIWMGSHLVISETLVNLQELWQEGSMTMELSSPMEVAKLPLERAHGYNLPVMFDQDSQVRARLQLFPLGAQHQDDKTNVSRIQRSSAPVLLDADSAQWRGWFHHGEATFLQRKGNVGLQLTDRGQWIQHRITQCRHPRWMNYLGFQFKVILLCERLPSSNKDKQCVAYGFTRVCLEAIRLHENSQGNIQHHCFRNDQGWERHGVTLAHLVEELC